MPSMQDFEARILELEKRLRPIANRPVDITKPGWSDWLTQLPHPLERAGVRREAEALLEELLDSYCGGEDDTRQALRNLFVKYRAFAWAANLPFEPITEEDFRRHVLLFSLKDQGADGRDAVLWLQELCQKAASTGVSLAPVLKEVADLSSDINKHGMGSTRQMLLSKSR